MRKNVFPMTAGVLGSLALAVSASGQFIDVTIEPFDAGAPAGFATYRVVAHFVADSSVMLAWGGIPDVAKMVFFTGNGVDLLNDPKGLFFGFKDEDFAFGPPFAADWDSWVTVGSTDFMGNDTNYTPNFAGQMNPFNVIKGNALNEVDGLVFDSDPITPVLGGDVVMAQFTLPGVQGGGPGDPDHNGFHLEGIVAWNPFPGAGPFQVSTFLVSNIPAPGALALLGLAGLAGARRRRRR